MEPLTLALLGGGSTLASMFLNSSAQDAVDSARNGVMTAERARQLGLDTEAKGVTDKSLGRYSDFGAQQDADAARLSDFFKKAVTTPNTPYTVAALPPVASAQTAREVGMKNGIADAYVNHQADSLGKLRSFGDLLSGIGRGVAQDTGEVGQIGNFKKGSSAVEQLELDNANRAGNEQKMWADIAGGLGKVGLTAGLSGSFAPPLPTAGAAPANIFSTGASPFLNYR
jgi:hypothetical protein